MADSPMNICMVGYGMMGTWHTDALGDCDVVLHTLVGRRADAAKAFAEKRGYRKWTTDYPEALADDEIDLVILANPSQIHAETALASIAHGKPTLVEIPIAMNLADAERVVAAARQRKVTLGMVHPMRMRPEMIALRQRTRADSERITQITAQFCIHRLENVGGTGYRRSWTDNLLWHHITHSLDFGLWLLNAPPVRKVHSFMTPVDPRTGIPMEVFLAVEAATDQALICTGSYSSHDKAFGVRVITDRNAYRLDVYEGTLTTKDGTQSSDAEARICGRVTEDFVAAVRDGREPAITGESVLPAMRVLQAAQDQWDQRHGPQSVPGRPLAE